LSPNSANNCSSVGVVPSQTVKVPLVPGFGAVCSDTVTVAVAFPEQGSVAITVYV